MRNSTFSIGSMKFTRHFLNKIEIQKMFFLQKNLLLQSLFTRSRILLWLCFSNKVKVLNFMETLTFYSPFIHIKLLKKLIIIWICLVTTGPSWDLFTEFFLNSIFLDLFSKPRDVSWLNHFPDPRFWQKLEGFLFKSRSQLHPE